MLPAYMKSWFLFGSGLFFGAIFGAFLAAFLLFDAFSEKETPAAVVASVKVDKKKTSTSQVNRSVQNQKASSSQSDSLLTEAKPIAIPARPAGLRAETVDLEALSTEVDDVISTVKRDDGSQVNPQ
jgi:hypothetical protein